MAVNASSPASQYNTTDEVIWLVSVTQLPDWEKSRFELEYHGVHANMTRQLAQVQPALRGYTQIKNLEIQHLMADQPEWSCITRLTWESLSVIWSGFQDPNYRENAGKHMFCRLDQVGALVKVFGSFQVQRSIGESQVRAFVFHRREVDSDEASEWWLRERLGSARARFSAEAELQTYRLLVDVVPKDVDFFFKDTQFAEGSWTRFVAVEEFVFAGSKADALKFIETHREFIEMTPKAAPPQIILGEGIEVV